MYNIIPLILILASLSIIIAIVGKKFRALSNVDIANIPREKEAKVKEEILSNRLKRNILMMFFKFSRWIKPALNESGIFFKWLYKRLHELKEGYKEDVVLGEEEAENKIEESFEQVDDFIKSEDLDEAEKKLIEIINIDNKNIEAFKSLGEIYFERGDLEEAIETFKHVLKLGGEDAEVYFDSALVYKEMGNIGMAEESIRKALEIEPNNPRYLDTIFDISIINKDKRGALIAYKKLKEVNPENQKLNELKEQIDELS